MVQPRRSNCETPSSFPTPPPPLPGTLNGDFSNQDYFNLSSNFSPFVEPSKTLLPNANIGVLSEIQTTVNNLLPKNVFHASKEQVEKLGDISVTTYNPYALNTLTSDITSLNKTEEQTNKINENVGNQLAKYHTYTKKTPVNFIDLKYWHLCVKICRLKTSNKHKLRWGYRHLLKAFYNLYREYSYVCDTCLPSYQDQTMDPVIKDCMIRAYGDQQKLSVTTKCFSSPKNSVKNKSKKKYEEDCKEEDLGRSSFSINNSFRDSPCPPRTYTFPYITKRLKKCGVPKKQILYESLSTVKSSKGFNVYMRNKVRHVRVHEYSRVTLDSNGRTKIGWSSVPISLELLLPKIQNKVSNVMENCAFLADPLEVLAELRYFNYNVNACIEYFRKTLDMRSIIEEYVPSNVNQEIALPETHNISSAPKKVNDLTACDSFKLDMENYRLTMEELTHGLFSGNVIGEVLKQPSENKEVQTFWLIDMEMGEKDETTNQASKKTNNNEMFDFSDVQTQTTNSQVRKTKRLLELTIQNLAVIKSSKASIESEIVILKKTFAAVITLLTRHFTGIITKLHVKTSPDRQKNEVSALHSTIKELKQRLQEEEKRRKKVFNMMQEQLGNVRVYCRCRDLPDQKSVLEIPTHDSIIVSVPPCEEFKFDKVFASDTNQSDLYREFEPLILSFIDGYNVCFITYGGEASGKTYTLVGENQNHEMNGLMQRALGTVLNERITRRRDWAYKLNAAIVEIYNDSYSDFLSTHNEAPAKLPIDSGLEAVYQSLKNVPINNQTDVEALIQVCKVKRRTAKTALNPASSRSHLIILIRLRGVSQIHGEQFCSFLGLCDLAGFEDIIKAETQGDKRLSQEAGYINRSLTAFNRVFVSLRKQDPNTVPYREAKLTYLLKPFLIRSGKCCLVITVRTDKMSIGSTQNTLRFGRETRGVKLGRALRQVDTD